MPESLFDQEPMDMLSYPTKLAAFSDSVHSSDGSLISVFNSEAVQPTSPITYTDLETSIELPIGDPSFIQQILDQTNLTPSLPDFDLGDELFKGFFEGTPSFDTLSESGLEMTINSSLDPPVPFESQTVCVQSENSTESTIDEQTTSPQSCISDENERADVNRRGMKKSGGPVGKLARFGNKSVIKYSNEYHDRRVKNNEAVKKSRMKAKEKQQYGELQMNKLSQENRLLNDRVELLMKELQVLRSLYKDLKHDVPVQKD